jgi:molybdate transport system substrate-binding protein
MKTTITGISSMATRQLLADLSRSFEQTAQWNVEIESMGGVDAARLVRGGKAIDVIVLASNVMEQLENEGWIVPGTRSDIARSGVAIAVRSGLLHPAIESEEDVKQGVLGAEKSSYSSGPSGSHLKRLFERWNIAELIADRTGRSEAGHSRGPVGGSRRCRSQFPTAERISRRRRHRYCRFAAGGHPNDNGVHRRRQHASAHPEGARAFVAHLISPEMQAAKQKLGMEAG